MSKKPEEVFTPREPKVNANMYIDRPELETPLTSGLNDTKHLILHGESGSGKSWLYKKVLSQLNAIYEVANLANASRFGSISDVFKNMLSRKETAIKESYTESKIGEVNAGLAKGQLNHTNNYKIEQKEPFEALLCNLRKQAGSSKALLVLDNLESIFDSRKYLKELADLITLLDDDSYADYQIKFLIVGVPSGLHQYFYKTPHMTTVANRVKELPEVFRLTDKQTSTLIKKGFVNELGYIDENNELLKEITKHIIWVTDRIPQKVHEYCLQLAKVAFQKSKKLEKGDLKTADQEWLKENLYKAYSAVEASMNERSTKIQRRNQVIYTLGQLEQSGFTYNEVEYYVRQIFPKSTADEVKLNISQMLSHLASISNSIIRKSPKGDTYVFTDPVYKMCIRVMFSLDDEQIVKKEINNLFPL